MQTFLALALVHNPKGGVLAGHLPTWVGILLAVGGAEMSVCHGYGRGVGYDRLSLGNFHTVYEVLIFVNRGV